MKTSGKIELGRRRAVWELPAELANLHHKVSIGSSCFLKLAPRPSKHWDARRAAEMAVGAGFTLDKPCFFRSQIAFLSVTKIESLPDSVGPENADVDGRTQSEPVLIGKSGALWKARKSILACGA